MRFRRLLEYLATSLLAIPFVAVVGEYVVYGLFDAVHDPEYLPPTVGEIVQLSHSLVVLYAFGCLVAGRNRPLSAAIVVTGIARLPMTRDSSGSQLMLRGRADVVSRGQQFLSRQSRALTVNEYRVADELGVGGRIMMWGVSSQARTRTMFMTDVEQQNAINHCLWQCHYTMLGGVSVAIAFGNAHEDGNPCALGDTIADRINNEVARRGGAELRRDYVTFFAAMTTSVAKALVDIVRDRVVGALGRPRLLQNAHEWLTLDRISVRTECDDFCENAWRQGWLSRAQPGDNFFDRLNTTEVETRYVQQLLRLLQEYNVRPSDILTQSELRSLRDRADERRRDVLSPNRSSVTIEEVD